METHQLSDEHASDRSAIRDRRIEQVWIMDANQTLFEQLRSISYIE